MFSELAVGDIECEHVNSHQECLQKLYSFCVSTTRPSAGYKKHVNKLMDIHMIDSIVK